MYTRLKRLVRGNVYQMGFLDERERQNAHGDGNPARSTACPQSGVIPVEHLEVTAGIQTCSYGVRYEDGDDVHVSRIANTLPAIHYYTDE